MDNKALLKCAGAFLILSIYIWLFGIAGVIEGEEAPVIFADDSLEFIPTLDFLPGRDGQTVGLSGGAERINPVNDPKPGAEAFNRQARTDSEQTADEPAETTSATTPASTTTTPTQTTTTTAATSTTTPNTTTTTTTTHAETTPSLPDVSERISVRTANGTVTDTALSIISRIVQLEIGSAFHTEAIKAQAVAAYTYVMLPISQGGTARVEMANVASERVTDAVRAVIGEAIYYSGDYIQAVYHASSAGYTASASNVWSGSGDFPYLKSVRCEFDKDYDPNFGLTATFTSEELRVVILEKTGIQLTGDPAKWFEVLSHVDEIYVGTMRVGGNRSYTSGGEAITFTGKTFRDIIGTRTLRSAAFDHTYNASADRFTFVTYGYGHGVGMSQNGANTLATHFGYTYKQILAHYYPGTTVS